MNIALLHPDATPEHLGLLPSMLDEDDPRPAKEQFNENYAHGGGWRPLPKFKLTGKLFTLQYPGDPPLHAIAMTKVLNEVILFYDHAIVVILQADGTFEAARMD